MSADGYTDGIRNQTGFKGNGFGIDPEGCGCTHCLTGQAFWPSDETRIKAAIHQGRPLYNWTGDAVILPNGYRLRPGQKWKPKKQKHCPGCSCVHS